MGINLKNDNDVIVCQHDVIIHLLFIRDFSGRLETENNIFWFYSNIRELEQIMDIKFDMGGSDEKLLTVTKY